MQKLIAQIEKQIAASRKEFQKAGKTIARLREKNYREWSDKECSDFTAANIAYQKEDKVLTILYPALEKLKNI